MPSLNLYNLLLKSAQQIEDRELGVSLHEVKRKIQEIKYLTAQKKIPKLSLRKEILELDQYLRGLYQVGEHLRLDKRKEAIRISALKRQIAQLKKNLAATKDKDLHLKVDKLSNLLGESLARKEIKDKIFEEKQRTRTKKRRVMLVAKQDMLQQLEEKLMNLKRAFIFNKEKEKDREKIKKVAQQIALLEGKIQAHKKSLGIEESQKQGKHILSFRPIETEKTIGFERQLPLPPPPRRN